MRRTRPEMPADRATITWLSFTEWPRGLPGVKRVVVAVGPDIPVTPAARYRAGYVVPGIRGMSWAARVRASSQRMPWQAMPAKALSRYLYAR
jgi:hypothetical protein